MKKKAVFFDIDGTLSDELTFDIPQSTKAALKQARANGHYMFVNTGRVYCAIEPAIKQLDMDGFICGCGTHIVYHGQTLYHHRLDDEMKQTLITRSFDDGVDSVLEGKDHIYYPTHSQHYYINNLINRNREIGKPIETYDRHDHIDFDKLSSWYSPASHIDRFKETFEKDFDFIRRADDFYEIVPRSCSKATGIQFLIDHLHISLDDTISIGDSFNDLPMLQYTKEAVAMGNSHPDLFDQVTYITTDLHDDGIYHALQHFGLID